MVNKDLLLTDVLPNVSQPARYTGHELNAGAGYRAGAEATLLLAFPDVYEVGMSYIGFKILYEIVNSNPAWAAERAFAPWPDMEAQMRIHGIPLYGLETYTPARSFDLMGFTLQYELTYSNVLCMLELAGIPVRADGRREGDPIIIAGGPCASNPEPMAPFLDLVVVGDGEEAIAEIMRETARGKREGASRAAIVSRLAKIAGVYWPQAQNHVTRRVVADLDSAEYPRKFVVPFLEAVHDRVALEVMRGCSRGCRFCQAGMIYRPVRERSMDNLCELAEALVGSSGYEELSLLSLSSADYTRIKELISKLAAEYGPQGVAVSLPSLRVDSFSIELARDVEKSRRTGLTFAPEAGTQRMRDIINKGVTEDDLISAASDAFESGWDQIKLYFMIGLPYETSEDIEGIAVLSKRVLDLGRRIAGARGKAGRVRVNVSVSSFVPKPHTPFQWFAQNTCEQLEQKQSYLRERMRARGLSVSFHDVRASHLEAAFARGDRRLAPVIERAVSLGCRFDGWSDQFKPGLWQQAFADTGLDSSVWANAEYGYSDALPWDHIDMGVSRAFLVREAHRAASGLTTPDCREADCSGCGVCRGDVRVRLAGAFAGSPSQGGGQA
ncbi:MAG TPA: TIGR03960 family B12-binding radical SAM protein [Bacillota bacterium]|nr:TIGR03960 family B12-binding radical SAM protein [Bacillota bacterium]